MSLVQLARTASAASRHAAAGLLSLGVYGSPTTGGVFASYASLVDLRAAVEHAVIGFAGPRVAEGTLGEPLPPGSHTAEAAYDRRAGRRRSCRRERSPAGSTPPSASGPSRCPPARCRRRPSPRPTAPGARCCGPGRSGRPTGIDRAARLCSSWSELRGSRPGRPRRPGHGRRVAVRRGGDRPLPRGGAPDPRRLPPGAAGGAAGGPARPAGGDARRHAGRRPVAGVRGRRPGPRDRPHVRRSSPSARPRSCRCASARAAAAGRSRSATPTGCS